MKLKLLFTFLLVQFCFSQQRTCGVEQFMQKLQNDPIALKKHQELQQKFEIQLDKIQNNQNKTVALPNVTINIPVAVHFPDEPTNSANKVCLRALAQTQLNVLNADYNATNTDILLWTPAVSANYPGVNIGSLDIQFILATQNHPAGMGLINGEKAVTFGTGFIGGADYDSAWSGYMNLVCRDAGGGILGYSPLGGSPGAGATVVITYSAFGIGTGCAGTTYIPGIPYDLGRTLTHELGHFFNLDHTFNGCSTTLNCAVAGDRVCDTPPTNAAVFGCPVAGSITKCSVKTLTMNYMDYTNDACMYMFTAGQATRMQAHYNAIASQFKNNVLSNNDFLSKNFSIIPNPNNGTFNIQLKEFLNQYAIEIFDTTGRIIFEKDFIDNQNLEQSITINNAIKGIYFVTIKSKSAILTKKIIVN